MAGSPLTLASARTSRRRRGAIARLPSLGLESAVDAEDVPGDEAGLIGQQKADSVRDLLGPAETVHRVHRADASLVVVRVAARELRGDDVRLGGARRERVDAHAFARVV